MSEIKFLARSAKTVGSTSLAPMVSGFGELLKGAMWETPRDTLVRAEALVTQEANNPGANNKLDLIMALAEADLEVHRMTAIFTKAHDAYEKILNMPV